MQTQDPFELYPALRNLLDRGAIIAHPEGPETRRLRGGVQMEELQPQADKLIVLPVAQPMVTAGGLDIPDMVQDRERPSRGVVLKVGPGGRGELNQERIPIDLQPGDLALFGKYSGVQLVLGGLTVLLMSAIEVSAMQPAGTFGVVTHGEQATWHLENEPCRVCSAPSEAAAKSELEKLREQLVKKDRGDGAILEGVTPAALEPLQSEEEKAEAAKRGA